MPQQCIALSCAGCVSCRCHARPWSLRGGQAYAASSLELRPCHNWHCLADCVFLECLYPSPRKKIRPMRREGGGLTAKPVWQLSYMIPCNDVWHEHVEKSIARLLQLHPAIKNQLRNISSRKVLYIYSLADSGQRFRPCSKVSWKHIADRVKIIWWKPHHLDPYLETRYLLNREKAAKKSNLFCQQLSGILMTIEKTCFFYSLMEATPWRLFLVWINFRIPT